MLLAPATPLFGGLLIRFLATYVAIFRLLWITDKVKGEFGILKVRQDGNVTELLLPLNEDTKAQGKQSLFWASRLGHCVVEPGEIGSDGRWFKVHKDYGQQPIGTDGAWLSGWLGERLEHFGDIEYDIVKLPNGTLATQTKKSSQNWVIHVHGRKTLVAETYRNFEQFDELGFRQLSISHETDQKPMGLGKHRTTLGFQEWKQLEAAVVHAQGQGAKKIVLFGWSLGGMIVGQFLRNSTIRTSVVGSIFDSPMFDVRNTLRLQAELSGYSAEFADEVCERVRLSKLLRILGYPKLDFDAFSLSIHRIESELPSLLMYSKNDGYVAYEDAESFAQLNRSVRLVEFPSARHCRLMNSDPVRYAETIKSFISELDI